MNRTRGLTLVLALGAALPMSAAAQEFKDTKYTKDADKFLALAMTRSDPADRANYYRQALAALAEGFTREANNAKIWYTAGQAHVGLSNYVAADSCFDKAVQLHPDISSDIEAEREAGWMAAFEQGVALMDEEKHDEALTMLQSAEVLYDKRPEALLNIGSIHANRGNNDLAEEAFRKAAAAAQGELYEKLDSASQANWKSYVEMATLNIAQMRGQEGVGHFETEDYEAAAAAFKSAMEVNPYSRDYLFNYVQAKYAKASDLEAQLTEDSTKLAVLTPELVSLYTELQAEIPKVRVYDPTNENLVYIQARALRREGELKGDTTANVRTLRLLEEIDAVPVEVTELTIGTDQGTATVAGKVRNKKLAEGSPVTVRVTLLGYKGDTIGQMTVTVNAGAAGEEATSVSFEQTATITGSVAGWKYEVTTT